MAKPLRLELGACIIHKEYGYSDEEVTLQIHEGRIYSVFADTGNLMTASKYDDIEVLTTIALRKEKHLYRKFA